MMIPFWLKLILVAVIAVRLRNVALPAPCFRPAEQIDPSYIPKPLPLEGAFAPNAKLSDAVRLFEGHANGSESAAIAPDGSLYLMSRNGAILHATPVGANGVPVLHTAPMTHVGGGRPLGAHFDASGNLIFCHPPVGLMMLEQGTHRPVLLTSHVGGLSAGNPAARILYPNDLDIDHQEPTSTNPGTIFFTDSTDIPPAMNANGFYDTMWSYKLTALHGAPSGRLLKYNPETAETSIVAKDLWFPNGVALSADGSFVAVAETAAMRIRRVWLAGAKAGQVDTLIDKLPGYPDGVSRAADGGFWVAIVAPSQPMLQAVLPHRWLRGIIAHLMAWVNLPLKASGMILKVSASGEPEQFLMDSSGKITSVASTVEQGSRLYLGNLAGDYISYIDLPAAATA